MAQREQSLLIDVQDVPREQTGSYGIVAASGFQGRHGHIDAIVEKPRPEVAPSTLAVVGRYVLGPGIFPILERTRPGPGGEIQLTDAIATMLEAHRILAYRFEGRRFDCGSRIGLVEATIQYALDHDDLNEAARAYMRAALDG
jgi:UTP--glucose-1-phosphate uridylyltransferase